MLICINEVAINDSVYKRSFCKYKIAIPRNVQSNIVLKEYEKVFGINRILYGFIFVLFVPSYAQGNPVKLCMVLKYTYMY